VSHPVADQEIEVVRAIALRKERGIGGGLAGLGANAAPRNKTASTVRLLGFMKFLLSR